MFWIYWHGLSSFIFDVIQLVIKKDSTCNEIEFYLDLRIHYQFLVISQQLYRMIIVHNLFHHAKKNIIVRMLILTKGKSMH